MISLLPWQHTVADPQHPPKPFLHHRNPKKLHSGQKCRLQTGSTPLAFNFLAGLRIEPRLNRFSMLFCSHPEMKYAGYQNVTCYDYTIPPFCPHFCSGRGILGERGSHTIKRGAEGEGEGRSFGHCRDLFLHCMEVGNFSTYRAPLVTSLHPDDEPADVLQYQESFKKLCHVMMRTVGRRRGALKHNMFRIYVH